MITFFKFSIIFVIIVTLKITKNYISIRQCEKIMNDIVNSATGKLNIDLHIYKDTFLRLTHNANISDRPIVVDLHNVNPFAKQATIKFLFPHKETLRDSIEMLKEAYGTYKNRISDSVNPFYWGEILFFMPAITLRYLGLSKTKFFPKLLNLIYWVWITFKWLFPSQGEQIRSTLSEFVATFFSKP